MLLSVIPLSFIFFKNHTPGTPKNKKG